MFWLVDMKDTVRLPPHLFKLQHNDAIIECLNKKFANKVVHKVGLCIALWDVTKLEDSYIFPGDGSSHTVVHFRYVVFRPFQDEILVGKIRSSSKEGINVSLGFFDDILIPADALQHPSRFDESEQVWVWEYEGNPLFMDTGEQIRFRVVQHNFVDTTPVGPETGGAGDAQPEVMAETPEVKKSPYTLVGSISESGLGLLSWWST